MDYGPISTGSLLTQVKNFPWWRFNPHSPFSGLHCASLFGIVEVVAGLIAMEYYDINEGDFSGSGPFTWVAWNGHEGGEGSLGVIRNHSLLGVDPKPL